MSLNAAEADTCMKRTFSGEVRTPPAVQVEFNEKSVKTTEDETWRTTAGERSLFVHDVRILHDELCQQLPDGCDESEERLRSWAEKNKSRVKLLLSSVNDRKRPSWRWIWVYSRVRTCVLCHWSHCKLYRWPDSRTYSPWKIIRYQHSGLSISVCH